MRNLITSLMTGAAMVVALAAAPDVQAAPIAAGSMISINGQNSYNNTAVDFTTNGNIGPGTATGSFAVPFGAGCTNCAVMTDFSYNPLVGTPQVYNAGLGPNNTTFTITGITSFTNGAFLNISAIGTATLTGFDPTPGTFSFSSQGGNNVVTTFSATTSASAVPEPASLALFAGALIGLGAIRRRQTTKAALKLAA